MMHRDLYNEMKMLEARAKNIVLDFLSGHENEELKLDRFNGPQCLYKEYGTMYAERLIYRNNNITFYTGQFSWKLEDSMMWGYEESPCPYLQLLDAIDSLQEQNLWHELMLLEKEAKKQVIQLFDKTPANQFVFPAKDIAEDTDFSIDGKEVLGPKEHTYMQRARIVELTDQHNGYHIRPYADDRQTDMILYEGDNLNNLVWLILYDCMRNAVSLIKSKNTDPVQWELDHQIETNTL